MELFCILICIYVVKALWKAWIYHESSPYAHPMKPEWLYLWKPFHRYGIPWETCFHTDGIPMERFSTGWLTPGKAHSIGWLYLWKVNSIRIVYVWKDIPYGHYRYGFGHQYQEYTYGMLTLCYPYSLPYVDPMENPMETPIELRLY